jgi:ribonuclease Z
MEGPAARHPPGGHGGSPELSVVFLGTGARWPTPERGVAAAVVCRGSEHLLVDCGEGTQRQMMLSTPGLRRLSVVLITHCHPDHTLGLPGLIATLSGSRDDTLTVLGPRGVVELLAGFRIHFGRLDYPLDVREVEPGGIERRDGYRLIALSGRHDCPAVGWALAEDPLPGHLSPAAPDGAGVPPDGVRGPARRGRRLVFSGDTRPAPAIERAAAGADLLVHEATFLERDRLLADESGHSTAAQAAALAGRAGVAMLALTHRSSRYTREEALAEAAAVFRSTVAPRDLDAIEVPLPEHGPPRLIPGGGAVRNRVSSPPARPDR